MKKVNKVILVLSLIFLTNYVCAESDFNKEAIRFNNSVEAKGWQSENPDAIFYRKNTNDGMSWRKRKLNYDKTDKKLSKEKLMSTIWKVDAEKTSSGILLFYSDDYFAIGSVYADIYAFGKYSLEDDKVILSDYDFNKNITYCLSLFDGKSVTGSLNYETDSFLYANEIVFNGISFYPADCKKENGAKAKINNIPVIVDVSKKVLTDNVKFRTAPSTSAKTQKVWLYDEMYNVSVESVKKGTVIDTRARTTKLEEYDGVKGYWYYIYFSVVDAEQYGWIFGGYLEGYDENKKDEYSKALSVELKNKR